MAVLRDYRHFDGYHWETGSVHNVYAYRGVRAPHTGKPYSEPLLMGISGGIVMGYFTFSYQGYDPQCNILTRNTFDPLDTLLSRLGIVQYREQTAKPDKAMATLLDTLADGSPAIVWADMWRLPYNGFREDEGMWGTFPIVVYGYDRETDQVLIADRANVPLTASGQELAAARGRIKKEKHRLLTLDIPNPEKLASAVRLGLNDCLQLFTEKPPKGSTDNFGLAAYRFWANALTNPKGRASWAKLFPPGVAMYAGLTTAYRFAFVFGKGLDADAERSAYAQFVDEAAVILDKPALHEAANRFRVSAQEWRKLAPLLLPDHVAPFAEARRLIWQRHESFMQKGNAALEEMREIDQRLATIRRTMASDFPLTEGEVILLREQLAEQIMRIHDSEEAAVEALREALA